MQCSPKISEEMAPELKADVGLKPQLLYLMKVGNAEHKTREKKSQLFSADSVRNCKFNMMVHDILIRQIQVMQCAIW